jgi:peptidyl-prolyl cis-trans isomerase B (cyclophilin B)
MNGWQEPRILLLQLTAGLLTASTLLVALAQEPTEEPPDPIQFLRAEATVERTLFSPAQPIAVRFTLFNPTADPIEIPAARTTGEPDGIALPRALITGTSERPALFIAAENEKPVPMRPEAQTANDEVLDALCLAPHASLGAQIDLRGMHRLLRYSGNYELQWQPLGGRVETATVAFRVEARKDAVLVTDYGKTTFALLYDKAPRNVENFLELVRERFYDGKTIHRIERDFVIQGGSPDGSRTGIRPDGKLIPAEFHDTPFELGTLAMARKPRDPDSASCQFFVGLARLPELDGKYTVIGQARDEESQRALRQIAELPTDGQGRPLRPPIIRFFTLVDAEAGAARRPETIEQPAAPGAAQQEDR